MIYSVNGTVELIEPNLAVIDCGGVGYACRTTANTLSQLKIGEKAKLLTYLSIQAQLQKSRYVQLPLGRVELAEYLCVDRSALTRELVKMKEAGLIEYDKNCFRIL